MFQRIVLLILAGFWVTMNVLLWRVEYGSRYQGAPVPVHVVWQKILTAPDHSALTILHRGTKIGFCNWTTSVGEEWANVGDENIPAAGIPRLRQHQLRLEGAAIIPDFTNGIQFESSLTLNTSREWQAFRIRGSIRPIAIEIRSSATNRTVEVLAEDGDALFGRVFGFDELRNPEMLARQFLGPFAGEMIAQIGLPPELQAHAGTAISLKWEAREDTVRIGSVPVRVYRLYTSILDRYPVTILISRVGEVLRVELPGELILLNEPLNAS